MKLSEFDFARIALIAMAIWFFIWGAVLGLTTMWHLPTVIGFGVIAFFPLIPFWQWSKKILSKWRG